MKKDHNKNAQQAKSTLRINTTISNQKRYNPQHNVFFFRLPQLPSTPSQNTLISLNFLPPPLPKQPSRETQRSFRLGNGPESRIGLSFSPPRLRGKCFPKLNKKITTLFFYVVVATCLLLSLLPVSPVLPGSTNKQEKKKKHPVGAAPGSCLYFRRVVTAFSRTLSLRTPYTHLQTAPGILSCLPSALLLPVAQYLPVGICAGLHAFHS